MDGWMLTLVATMKEEKMDEDENGKCGEKSMGFNSKSEGDVGVTEREREQGAGVRRGL
jgi:hypothetical protein